MAEPKSISKNRMTVLSLSAVFAFLALAVVLIVLFDNVPFILPTLTSVALVVVTAALTSPVTTTADPYSISIGQNASWGGVSAPYNSHSTNGVVTLISS